MKSFQAPKRCIFADIDMQYFLQSQSYKDFVGFTRVLNDSVRSVRVSDTYPISSAVKSVLQVLDQLDQLITEFPPSPQPMRFGNKSYRNWYDKVMEISSDLFKEFLPSSLQPAIIELMAYWNDSFGNRTRIDYGTGHEACFVLWLYCLYQLEFFVAADCTAMVLQIFNRYIKLMRRMQVDYMLEPAGSHGVWGLDDYQCLVFYFGSSQLIGQEVINPSCIHKIEVLETQSDDFLYIAAIKFIREVKAGSPFAETSPMLNDISGVPSWTKVNAGMLKLFEGEVLKKLPVIQHLRFGSLFPATWTPSEKEHDNAEQQQPPGLSASAYYDIHTPMESHKEVQHFTMAPWAKKT